MLLLHVGLRLPCSVTRRLAQASLGYTASTSGEFLMPSSVHTRYSIMDPCVLKRVRMGPVQDTDADPGQEETVSSGRSVVPGKTQAAGRMEIF